MARAQRRGGAGLSARWRSYRRQVVRIATTARGLHAAIAGVPLAGGGADGEVDAAPTARRGGARLLWISDVHDNPLAADLVRALLAGSRIDAVLDTGDLTDHGLGLEHRLSAWVGGLGVPYVWVRGNHDGRSTQAYLDALPGVTVLDDGAITEVSGLRIAGTGDQEFTPWRRAGSGSAASQVALAAAFERADAALAASVRASAERGEPVHVVAVHRRPLGDRLHGEVDLVLDGHTHRRRAAVHDGTLRLTQGSTGGAGVRGVEADPPVPLCATVLVFDASGSLVEAEEVTVGGLGERWVRVERRSAGELRGSAGRGGGPRRPR